jgi:transposase-like protein
VSKRKRRFTQDFKLQALSRMETAETITLLAAELGVRREMLHKWRRALAAHGR